MTLFTPTHHSLHERTSFTSRAHVNRFTSACEGLHVRSFYGSLMGKLFHSSETLLPDAVILCANEVHEIGHADVDGTVGRAAEGVLLAVTPDV